MYLAASNSQSQQSPAPQSRIEMYVQFLTNEGFQPKVGEIGFISFKREGLLYLLIADAKDEQFFRLMFPNFWKIESEEERQRALAACNEANEMTKVAKLFIHDDNMCTSVEMFFANPEDFKGVFGRSMSALENGTRNFVQAMNGVK